MDTNITKRAVPLLASTENEAAESDAIAEHLMRMDMPLTGPAPERLTIGEAAKSVGAWENRDGYICFGSWMAVRAFGMKMQRDLAVAHHHAQPGPRVADMALLVSRLSYQLNKANPGNELSQRATAYLKQHNLIGSPLRTGAGADQ